MDDLTRKQMIALVWNATPRRSKGRLAGERAILVLRGQTLQMVPLRGLPSDELRQLAEGLIVEAHIERWRTAGFTMVHHWWPGKEWAVVYGPGKAPAVASLRTGRIEKLTGAGAAPFGVMLRRATAEAGRRNRQAAAAATNAKEKIACAS